MDSLNRQQYEEQIEEAGRIADSYPRDENQTLTQSWLDSINATFARRNANLREAARLTRRAA
jgi:hypothetical protein